LKIDCDPVIQVSYCRFDGHPVKLIPVVLELNRAEIADSRVAATEEKKPSIAALSQTLPERLMRQTTPWSAIKTLGLDQELPRACHRSRRRHHRGLDDHNVEDWS
jgi:hypothetical protein